MDYLEFSANIIRSLAWPTAVIGGILILRKEISSLVKEISSLVVRLQEFRLLGIQGKFRKGLKEGKEKVGKITIGGAKPKIQTPLTSDFPDDDVIAAFEKIEETLERIRPLVDENLPTYRSIVERLEREGYIETEASQLFNTLREARNEARNAAAPTAGSLQISIADAGEYQQQARLLNDVFEDALRRLQTNPLTAQPRPAE
jgi:hypothetical protein